MRSPRRLTTAELYILAAYIAILGLLALGVFTARDREQQADSTPPNAAPTAVSTPKPRTEPLPAPGPHIRRLGKGVSYEPRYRLPYLIIVDPNVDDSWHVEDAVHGWNRLTGCRLFTLDPTEPYHSEYIVSEQRGLKYIKVDGSSSGPIWGWQWGSDIRLNPDFGTSIEVPYHELGHVIGLDHHDGNAGVMNPAGVDDDLEPSDDEINLVREIQTERCEVSK